MGIKYFHMGKSIPQSLIVISVEPESNLTGL